MIHLVVVDEPAQVPRRAAHEPVYGTVDEYDHLSHDHASTVSAPDDAVVQIRRRRVPNPIAVPKRAAARRCGEGIGVSGSQTIVILARHQGKASELAAGT